MKDVYQNWSNSFIAGLDFIRSKDETILEHPVYLRRSAELSNTLSFGVINLAAANPKLNFMGITRDALYNYHQAGRTGDPELDFIIASAKCLCESLRVSENFYDIEALSFCLLVVQGQHDYAMKYLHRLIRPAVMLYRIRDSAHFTGLRGGKPRHKLYREGLMLAGAYMAAHPDATYSNVAKNVRSKLLVNHQHVPAERTIRDWLSKF